MNRTRRLSKGAVLGWLGLALLGPVQVPAATVPPAEKIAFEVRSLSDCCPSELTLDVMVGGHSHRWSLYGHVAEVVDVRAVADGRFLVHGKLKYGGDVLFVVGNEEGEQELELWTYGFSVSPSGRWLAYETHYPRMSIPGARNSIVLLYDLSRTPLQNRGGAERMDWPEHNDGLPIFPPENACAHNYRVTLADPPYLVTSDLLWSADDDRLVFFVEREDRSAADMVRVAIGSPGCEGLALAPLDLAALNQCPDRQDGPPMFSPERIGWLDDQQKVVVARLNGPCPFGDRLEFPVP